MAVNLENWSSLQQSVGDVLFAYVEFNLVEHCCGYGRALPIFLWAQTASNNRTLLHGSWSPVIPADDVGSAGIASDDAIPVAAPV